MGLLQSKHQRAGWSMSHSRPDIPESLPRQCKSHRTTRPQAVAAAEKMWDQSRCAVSWGQQGSASVPTGTLGSGCGPHSSSHVTRTETAKDSTQPPALRIFGPAVRVFHFCSPRSQSSWIMSNFPIYLPWQPESMLPGTCCTMTQGPSVEGESAHCLEASSKPAALLGTGHPCSGTSPSRAGEEVHSTDHHMGVRRAKPTLLRPTRANAACIHAWKTACA